MMGKMGRMLLIALVVLAMGFNIVAQAQQAPPAFSKQSPPNGAVNVGTYVTLRWDAVAGTQKYCISTSNGCPNGDAGYITATGNTVTLNLLPNTTYIWQVRNYNGSVFTPANGQGQFWRFTTMPAVTKLSPVNGAISQPTTVNLQWSSYPAGTFARYCLSATLGCPNGYIPVNGTSVTVNVPAALTRYWHVRIYDSFGNFTPTNGQGMWWGFSTINSPPGNFRKTSPANGQQIQSNSVTLQWTAASGVQNYEVWYRCVSLSGSPCGESTRQVQGTQTSIATGSTGRYSWRIRACNQIGCTTADASTGGQIWTFTKPL
jgi:predicted secreted protein